MRPSGHVLLPAALAVALLLWPTLVAASRLPQSIHATTRLRAASQLAAAAAQGAGAQGAGAAGQNHQSQGQDHSSRRQLQALSPAPIRILPELQLPQGLLAAQQAMIQDAVHATLLTLSAHLQVSATAAATHFWL